MNKNILLPSFVGVAVLASVIAINANVSSMKKNIDLERYNRIEAERKLDMAMKNSQRLDEQLKDAKRKLEGIENIVSEGQSTANELKSKAAMSAKENEALKEAVKKLQDELAAAQKAEQERVAAVPVVTPPAAAN